MENQDDYRKLKLADGWYCLEDDIVINRSDNHCPAPVGSKLYCRKYTDGVLIDKDNSSIQLFHHNDVLAWMEPENE